MDFASLNPTTIGFPPINCGGAPSVPAPRIAPRVFVRLSAFSMDAGRMPNRAPHADRPKPRNSMAIGAMTAAPMAAAITHAFDFRRDAFFDHGGLRIYGGDADDHRRKLRRAGARNRFGLRAIRKRTRSIVDYAAAGQILRAPTSEDGAGPRRERDCRFAGHRNHNWRWRGRRTPQVPNSFRDQIAAHIL
ncbi:MAG TPA: hypothetical protein PKA55_01970 [Rhodoblastus sp.]|nr:hypothetical protein [Rhodoblastus sp.]